MHLTTYSLLIASIASSVLTSPVILSKDTISLRRRDAQRIASGKALYTITNDEKQNAVVAIGIKRDGTLGDACLTQTGGVGAVGVDAEGKPAVPDALLSQSALTVAGQHIFAVNAGSNTVSMLAISPNDPLSLRMVGKPAAIPGTFPNTVAASVKNSLVCVATSGSKAGVSCANFDAKKGIGKMDALRAFDLKQSDPPVGPLNTVSHTFFSEDESTLFTTVKGDPAVNNTGFLSAFPVGNAAANACAQGQAAKKAMSLSTQETRSSPNGTAVLFGSQIIPGKSQIFATDASFGAGILSVGSSMQASFVAKGTIADQKATCWSTISPVTNTAFVTDVGLNRVIEMSLDDASIISTTNLSADPTVPGTGLIDLKAAGGVVYALAPGNGTSPAAVQVMDLKSKKLVQHAALNGIGVGATAQGIAVLM